MCQCHHAMVLSVAIVFCCSLGRQIQQGGPLVASQCLCHSPLSPTKPSERLPPTHTSLAISFPLVILGGLCLLESTAVPSASVARKRISTADINMQVSSRDPARGKRKIHQASEYDNLLKRLKSGVSPQSHGDLYVLI